MAKQKIPEPVATPVAIAELPGPIIAAATGPTKFRVQLSAHGPIMQPDMEIEANSSSEAKRKFCEHNGIVDSQGQWTIERIS